jgi:hypothetical protein
VDLLSDGLDPLIQMMPVLHQALDQAHHARREDIGALGEDVRECLPQGSKPLSHRDPALEQKGADLVDYCCALADQAGANTMQSLQVELLDCLGGHEAHGLDLPTGELLAQDNGAANIQTDEGKLFLPMSMPRVATC